MGRKVSQIARDTSGGGAAATSLSAGMTLGTATTNAPTSLDTTLRNVAGLSIPLPAALIATTGVIDIILAYAWVDTPSTSLTLEALLVEDGVIINDGVIAMGTAVNVNAGGPVVVKYSHVPTVADHTYSAMARVSTGTARVFGESINPIVLAQLVVKAA